MIQSPSLQRLILTIALFYCCSTVGASAQTPQQRTAALEGHIELSLPSRPGVHPLAILLPGCLSWHPHHERWRDTLLSRGYAVLHIDSFAARGLVGRATLERRVCSGAELHGDERSGDLMAVLETLRERPNLDLRQAVIFGWSHGGWTALDFLSRVTANLRPANLTSLPDLSGIAFRAAFIFYPYCGPASLDGRDGFPTQTRTLLFHGTRDVITSPRRCRARAKALSQAGALIEYISMQGSHHWFDNHAEAATYDARATANADAAIAAVLETLESEQSIP